MLSTSQVTSRFLPWKLLLRFTATAWIERNKLKNSRFCWTQWAQLSSLGASSPFPRVESVGESVTPCADTDNSCTKSTFNSDVSHGKRSLQAELQKETSRSIKGWEKNLVTYTQLDFESDIYSPTLSDSRLVDDPRYKEDIELWVQLILFRRRVYGLESLRPFLKVVFKRKIHLSTELLDSGLLDYALQETPHDSALVPLTTYAAFLHRTKGERYDSLYIQVVRHFLIKDCSKAYLWHQLLARDLPPSERQFRELFCSVRGKHELLIILREIYKDLPFRGMYSFIIPKLCEDKTFAAATAWHHCLLMHGDLPPNPSYVEPLLKHLTRTGHQRQVDRETQKLIKAGVVFEESDDRSTKANIFMSREIINRIQGEAFGIAPKKLSDEFCARLFATKIFSIETVIKGLHVMGTETIGPLALLEIALRACTIERCHSETVIESLRQLKEADISIGESVLSRLIAQLAIEKEDIVLYDVVKSDLHPDVYEDKELQESLLVSYERDSDQRQINRTLAVLLLDEKPNHREPLRLNALFRSAIRRYDWTRMSQLFEIMKAEHIHLSKRSCRVVSECLMSERRLSKPPGTTEELGLIVNVWRTAMCGGSYVPPQAWIEILRRLGMTGQLTRYEGLALWLGRWYLDAKFRRSQMSFTIVHEKSSNAFPEIADDIVPWSQLHPCRVIFSDEVVRGVVAWGFQHSISHERYPRPAPDGSTNYDTRSPTAWMWGLRLLVNLRELGVWFNEFEVEEACINRLVTLFGPGISSRKINRLAMRNRVTAIEGYGYAMVHLWRHNLFSRLTETDDLDARIRALRITVWNRATERAKLHHDRFPRNTLSRVQPYYRQRTAWLSRFDIRSPTA